MDAAVAAAACLTVVEPTANGIGGDCFALVWTEGRLHGLNSSGPAPALADAESLRRAGHKEVPKYGWGSVTVPGASGGWAELVRRFGRRSLAEVLAPAYKLVAGELVVSSVTRNHDGIQKTLYRIECTQPICTFHQ